MNDKVNNGAEATGIEQLRKELDVIDGELMRLFNKRLDVAERIGSFKRVNSLPVTDRAREETVLAERTAGMQEKRRPLAEGLMAQVIKSSKQVQRSGLNLYLIGMPDCGKTRMGKRLADSLGMPLVDTDKYIMNRMKMSIDDIFCELGEEAFRAMESMVLKEIIKTGGHIVATGGGLPLKNGNDALLKNSGFTVFLDRRLEALLGQDAGNRPLLREGGDVDANVTRLYHERHDGYAAAADLTVDPDFEYSAERIALGYTEYCGNL